MSDSKEIRELQFNRVQLVIVFVLVIALGAFIFVLGVSVGKKQARLAQGPELKTSQVTEVIKPKVKLPSAAQSEKAASPQAKKSAPATEKKTSSAPSDIQKEIASFQNREKKAPDTKAASPSKPATKAPSATPKTNMKPAAADPKPSPKSVPQSTQPPGNLLYIQVVAASQKTEASRVADSIRKLGFSVFILDPLPGDRVPYYRVRVGGYQTEEERGREAEKLAVALKRKASEFYYPSR